MFLNQFVQFVYLSTSRFGKCSRMRLCDQCGDLHGNIFLVIAWQPCKQILLSILNILYQNLNFSHILSYSFSQQSSLCSVHYIFCPLSMAHTDPTLAMISPDSLGLPVDVFIVMSRQKRSRLSPFHAYLHSFYGVTMNIEDFCMISSHFNQDTLHLTTF